jgi:predicted acylesterase/phospholipase RssA
MDQRGLSVRFWGFLTISVVVGLVALDFVMSIGIGAGSDLSLAQWMGLATLRVVQALAALLVAITIGSAVWNILYWFSGLAPLLADEPLTLNDFGRSRSVDEEPPWVTRKAANAGNLQQFLSLKSDPEFRIGIVLAGGGAKGVYQAGALRALWEFLKANDALPYVRMIAGTSIGSWNAMFWLTGQVIGDHGNDGRLYEWWTSARLSSVVNPTLYRPVHTNYLAGNQVWRRQFAELFAGKNVDRLPYFYLTRTNVKQALLDYTTNRKPQALSPGQLPNYRQLSNVDASQDQPVPIQQLASAVFASMDIPPAFKRLSDGSGQLYEDGGVIDNLPIQFATWCEGCNLLFVLPLNATFAEQVSNVSIISRMARVLDVRQGILERNALTEISLYNQIIKAQAAGGPAGPDKLTEVHTKPSTTFCICPGPELEVGTFGFWSLKSHGRACYQLMYDATRAELNRFDFSLDNNDVWMAKVNPNAKIKYEDFTVR